MKPEPLYRFVFNLNLRLKDEVSADAKTNSRLFCNLYVYMDFPRYGDKEYELLL